MADVTHFDSWIQYISEVVDLGTATVPNASQYRFVLTNGLTITRTMNKAQLASAELLPVNGYSRQPWAPGSGVWDATQLRWELASVTANITATGAPIQWSSMLLWANSPTNTAALTMGAIDTATDRITITGHGQSNATEVAVTTTGTLPGGITADTLYYLSSISTNTIELYSNVGLTTKVDITSAGSGTHTLRLCGGRPRCFVNFASQIIGDGATQPLRFDIGHASGGNSNGI